MQGVQERLRLRPLPSQALKPSRAYMKWTYSAHVSELNAEGFAMSHPLADAIHKILLIATLSALFGTDGNTAANPAGKPCTATCSSGADTGIYLDATGRLGPRLLFHEDHVDGPSDTTAVQNTPGRVLGGRGMALPVGLPRPVRARAAERPHRLPRCRGATLKARHSAHFRDYPTFLRSLAGGGVLLER